MDIKENWLLWYTSFLMKKSTGSGIAAPANKSAIKSMSNQQLANEHKPIIRKLKKEGFILRLKAIFGVLI